MFRIVFVLAVALFPASLRAQSDPISLEAFEAYVTGRTLTYSSPLRPFGAEQYFEDRRVRWSYLDGECLEGVYYARDDQICFAYEGVEDAQCWRFYLDGGRLLAQFVNEPATLPLYETSESDEPLDCPGPKIGV